VPRILIAFDGSPEAQRALRWAPHFDDADVTVLGVVPTLAGSERIADSVDPTVKRDEFNAELLAAVEKLKTAGVAARALERAGNPAQVIIETAEENAFDLIVIGTRGRHAIERFLFGSTADKVARYAKTPVLLVR
jgi:nucleotide-binding universal stress UspA family protein